MTAQETPQATAIIIINIIVIKTFLTNNHKSILTTDRILNIIIIDHLIFLEKETTTLKTEEKIILSHISHIGITHNIQIDNFKTTKALHQNIKEKPKKYNLQMKQAPTLQLLKIQKLQNFNYSYTL